MTPNIITSNNIETTTTVTTTTTNTTTNTTNSVVNSKDNNNNNNNEDISHSSNDISANSSSDSSSAYADADSYRGIEKQPCPQISFEDALEEIRILSSSSSDSSKKKKKIVIVDTRTPKEYEEAHVWDAINIPLLSNDERHLLGLTYHKTSKEAAIDKGWELFEPRIQEFIKQFDQYKSYDRIYIYCWRGGMRSRIVTNLLHMHGYNNNTNNNVVCQLIGGYKLYLNDIVWNGLKKEFPKFYKPKFIVLLGNTGTRKTEILRRLHKEGLPVLDLEGLAGHRSSVYGSVDLKPKSQKMFSIGVYSILKQYQNEPFVFVEGEAHKVGDVHLPMFLNGRILNDINVLVEATMKTRIECIRNDYFKNGNTSIKQLHDCTDTISKYIGKKNAQQLHEMLDDGPTRWNEFIEWLLVNHYDNNYRFNKKNYEYDYKVTSNNLDDCCLKLTDFYNDLLKKKKIEEEEEKVKKEKKTGGLSSSSSSSLLPTTTTPPPVVMTVAIVAGVAVLGICCIQVFKKK